MRSVWSTHWDNSVNDVHTCSYHYSGDDDAVFISWMALKKGPPQRCSCGVWFKLTEGSSLKIDI